MFIDTEILDSIALLAIGAFRVAIDVAPLAIILLSFFLVRQHVQGRNMPLGPRGVPFIGNKHQVPSIKPWRKFAEWNKQYGAYHCFTGRSVNV